MIKFSSGVVTKRGKRTYVRGERTYVRFLGTYRKVRFEVCMCRDCVGVDNGEVDRDW